ncbi:MAG: GNAT family N-acetyltransferase [Eubacterium sp.]|nr:GNAT family N-acetyltransferase [Eubacterium sp.]
MLFVDWLKQKKGFGRELMKYWENDMSNQGYGMVMLSTQVDEDAQHFYRKIGYKDCGGFTVDIPGFEQPLEMFMSKKL